MFLAVCNFEKLQWITLNETLGQTCVQNKFLKVALWFW